jgi:hypothetical protein
MSRRIPRWLRFAVRDLYYERERIDRLALLTGQVEQSAEAEEDEWCRRVAELVATHLSAYRKAREYNRQERARAGGSP